MNRFVLLFLVSFVGSIAEASDNSILNTYCSKVESELVNIRLKYEHVDSFLFLDIQDVYLAIKFEPQMDDNEKSYYMGHLLNFIRDINTNLYAKKKVEDGEYRKAIRFYPSIVYYTQQQKLYNLINKYPSESVFALPFLFDEPQLKVALNSLGETNPNKIYNNLYDFYNLNYILDVVTNMASKDPITFCANYDKNSILKTIIAKNHASILDTILYIKNKYGEKSPLLALISMTMNHEKSSNQLAEKIKDNLFITKSLLEIIEKKENYGRVSALNILPTYANWLFDDFVENGSEIFKEFSNDDLMSMTVLCIDHLEKEDLSNLFNYINDRNNGYITIGAIENLPKKNLLTFYNLVQDYNLVNQMYSVMEINVVSYILSKVNEAEIETVPLQNQHWLNSSWDPTKEPRHKSASNAFAKSNSSPTIKKQPEVVNKIFNINKLQLSLINWTRNLNKIDKNFKSIVESPIGPIFINYLTSTHPQLLLNNIDEYHKHALSNQNIIKSAMLIPNNVKKYFGNSEHLVTQSLKNANNDTINILFSIYQKYGYNSKAYFFLDKLVSKALTIDEAHRIGENQISFLRTLCNVSVSKPFPLGKLNVEEEINQLGLKLIRQINDNPSVSNPTLNQLQQFDAKELYSLMIQGKEELFVFTFEQFYNSFIASLNGKDVYTFFKEVQFYKFREFAELLAEFNKFTSFMNYTSSQNKEEFIRQMCQLDFNQLNYIEQASILSEFLANCQDPEYKILLQKNIKQNLEKSLKDKDQVSIATYSLLASNIGHAAVYEREWFERLEQQFAKHTLNAVKVNDLKNKNNKIIEVCYFYNDDDGKASYNSFINTFSSMPKWMIQDIGSYLYITSLEGNDYEIFVNKPQSEQAGQKAIKEYLLINDLEPNIIVHRGHSYHTQKTIEQMLGSPRFIFMGSCGGYYKISELLERAPNAQIIATKQVGTMHVNDPMLRTIHEMLRLNKDIQWVDFWNEQTHKLHTNKDFKDYVPPHKNNGAQYINAFYNMIGL